MAFRPGRYVSFSEAVALLKEGGLLAFPTETFYAVGGSALDAGAVERVYQAKLRNPFPSPRAIADSSGGTWILHMSRMSSCAAGPDP